MVSRSSGEQTHAVRPLQVEEQNVGAWDESMGRPVNLGSLGLIIAVLRLVLE